MKTTKTSPERAVRRLVHMSTHQLAALKRASKRHGTSQAALLNRGIDLVIAETAKVKS